MSIPERQVIQNVWAPPSVSLDDVDTIMAAIFGSSFTLHRSRNSNADTELVMSAFTHPILERPAWAVEIWVKKHKWTHVFFSMKLALEWYEDQKSKTFAK